ncbi:four-jointed box protein 1-like [Liolophura sinensis]|uniref:four-jointed box protein 1-like n=1 Tax=Liolophura sinensis TaxID=3198878 RepID=UPI0031592663
MEILGTSLLSCRGIMKTSVYLMTGVAFSFGMIVGLLVRLPVVAGPGKAASLVQSRAVRSLVHTGGLTDNYLVDSILKDGEFDYVSDKGGAETDPSVSPNARLIFNTDNRLSDNKDLRIADQGKYASGQTRREIQKVKNPKGLPGSPRARLGEESVLESDAGDWDAPPAPHGVKVNLNANDQKMKNLPQGSNVIPEPDSLDRDANPGISYPISQQTKLSEKLSKLSDIIQGIQWTGKLEKLCPSGFTESAVSTWKKQVAEGKVVHLQDGCGRMQNRLLTLQDSSKACARYRPNTDQIQGEVYSYHLSRVLGMTNVPPTVLARVKSVEPQWSHVNQEIAMSQWADDKLVVLTRWIENLEPAYIPKEFREDTRLLQPTDSHLTNKSVAELCELVQWSDLIVFDYLTANLDRIVNNMFNQQWNSQMMESPAHNLEKDKNSGRLVFLDNESGLLHGYRLLDKYASYHEALLESVCVFRQSTIDNVEKLFLEDNIGAVLHQSFVLNEKFHQELPGLPEANVKVLNQRLGKVYDKMQRCRLQNTKR